MKFRFSRRVFSALGLVLLISGLIASVVAILRSTELRRRATETENRLVGEWKFDEGTGETVADSSGNGNNGTWYGTGNHWAEGHSGSAGLFNGVNDYLKTTNSEMLQLQSLTVSAWINPVRNTQPGITYSNDQIASTNKWGENTGWEFKIDTLLNQSGFHYGSENGYQTNTFVNTNYDYGNWNHVAATFNQGEIKWFINGSQVGTINNLSRSILYTFPGFSIGSLIDGSSGTEIPTHNFNGKIDKIRIYNYALTPEQIVADMETPAPSPTPTPTPPGPITCHDGFSDNFDGAGLDLTKWSVFSQTTGSTVTQSAGTLNINSVHGSFGGNGISSNKVLSGNFMAEATVDSFQVAADNVGSAELQFDSGNGNGGIYLAWRKVRGNSYVDIGTVASADGQFIASSGFNVGNATLVKLRMTRNGSTVKGYVDVGSGFQLVGTLFNAFSGEGSFRPIAIVFNDSNASISVSFDNFSLKCLSPTGDLDADRDVDIFDYNLLLEKFDWKGGPENGLVGYWPFDEGIGTIVADTSGNGKHGGWIGTGNHWVDGKFKKAGNFGGVDDRVEIPQFSPDTFSAMTISLWTNPDNQTVGNYAEHKDLIRSCANGGWWGISTNGDFNSSGKLNFNIGWLLGRDDWWNPPEAVIAKNTWNQLILVIDRISGRTAFYKNGLLISENVHTVGELHQSTGFNIGWDCAGPFSGIFDDIKIYNRVLSDQEIRELYVGQSADIDTDGDVDIFDYNLLLEHFGEHQ